MGKAFLSAGAILLAIIILIPVAIYYGSDARNRKFVPKFPDAQTPVTGVVPLSLSQVRTRLERKFGAGGADWKGWTDLKQPGYGPQFASFTVLPNDTGSIDTGFRATEGGFSSDAPIGTQYLDLQVQDPGLPAYLKLPIPARQRDLQIQSRALWTTPDYPKNGTLLPFRSDYFLHFKALSPNKTQITVLGHHATVIDGQRWSVVGDMFFTLPRLVDNRLSVPPSPQDKRVMLENVLKLLQ